MILKLHISELDRKPTSIILAYLTAAGFDSGRFVDAWFESPYIIYQQ